jgi:hypothetical protein
MATRAPPVGRGSGRSRSVVVVVTRSPAAGRGQRIPGATRRHAGSPPAGRSPAPRSRGRRRRARPTPARRQAAGRGPREAAHAAGAATGCVSRRCRPCGRRPRRRAAAPPGRLAARRRPADRSGPGVRIAMRGRCHAARSARSGGQVGAALQATRLDYGPPCPGGHAVTEAVLLGSLPGVGLVRPLHSWPPRLRRWVASPNARATGARQLKRPVGTPPGYVTRGLLARQSDSDAIGPHLGPPGRTDAGPGAGVGVADRDGRSRVRPWRPERTTPPLSGWAGA